MRQDIETSRIANATICSSDDLSSEMIAAGVGYLRREVLTRVESETEEFEKTIKELVDVMLEARQRPLAGKSQI